MDSIEVFWKKENKRKQLDNFKNVIDDKFYEDALSCIDENWHYDFLDKILTHSEKLTKEEREEYGNVFYHVTHSSNVQDIMKEGLKCMHQADRMYPKRVYMCAFKDFLSYKVKLMKIATEVLEDPMNAVAIKINMNSMKNINVYKDTVMDDKDYCFYTYDPIAPRYLSVVNLNMKNHYTLKKVNV